MYVCLRLSVGLFCQVYKYAIRVVVFCRRKRVIQHDRSKLGYKFQIHSYVCACVECMSWFLLFVLWLSFHSPYQSRVCMYVRIHVCMDICMYARTQVYMSAYMFGSDNNSILTVKLRTKLERTKPYNFIFAQAVLSFAILIVYMYVCMYMHVARTYACIYARMY